MRRKDKLRPEAEAWSLLLAAPYVHLAAVTADGRPLMRAIHVARHDGGLVLHGARLGDKVEALSGRVVVCAERVVAEIPSHFTHAERACPATTFFRSAMLHGTVRELTHPADKAPALQALMQRHQPQGGYRPITAEDPFYTASIDGVRVWHIVPDKVVAKAGLGSSKPVEWKRRALRGLWRLGQVDGVRELAEAWALSPWDSPQDGLSIILPDDNRAPEAAALLVGHYWTTHRSNAQLEAQQRGSTAWVGAEDADGQLIATARAVSDGARFAWVLDVAVAADHRGRGIGRAVMEVLLDHPALRSCQSVGLRTRDAGPFYASLGFEQQTGATHPTWVRAT